jgi:uncharacterized protein
MSALAIVFSRAPLPGRTKSRLSPECSPEERARLHRACLADTVAALADAGLRVEVHYTGGVPEDFFVRSPDPAEARMDACIGCASAFAPQGGGDLGERMNAAIEDALAETSDGRDARDAREAVFVVGSDIPGIDAELAKSALDAIESADVVLGPALDGGYYLIGMKAAHPRLFSGIEWGEADVAERTVEAAAAEGLSVSLLERRRDIDRPDDLIRFLDDARTEPRLRIGNALDVISSIARRGRNE